MKDKTWTKKSSSIVFNSSHMKLRKDVVVLPDSREVEWVYWDSPDSVMIIGTTEDKKIILEKQYRYLVGHEVLELPAGLVIGNETPEEAAKREFHEEVGYIAEKLVFLGAFYETYGQLNRRIHVFHAPNAIKASQDLDNKERGYEDIKIELVSLDEAVKMAIDNTFNSSPTVLSILLFSKKMEGKEALF